MNSENHVVIMAGGVGSRFWPMSTPECPKQFIDVLGCGRTLLQLTADRFDGICPMSNIWVVTSEKYADIVKSQLPQIPESNILLEPCMRNTAPCIAYVSWKIKKCHPSANIVVTPSDHIVMNVSEFQRVICESMDFTAESDSIVTLGIKPSRPEIGYGYIAADDKDSAELKKVLAFKEKPNKETAETYLKSGNYFWNAGIFIWNVKTIESAFRNYQPDIAATFDELDPFYYTSEEQTEINTHFPSCRNISIDYAIMEKAKDIFVFPADFGWSDLGTWGSLHGLLKQDEERNAVIGDNLKIIESEGCIIHVPLDKKVVIQGLYGYIVAEKNGTLLICKLSEEQRIKEFSK